MLSNLCSYRLVRLLHALIGFLCLCGLALTDTFTDNLPKKCQNKLTDMDTFSSIEDAINPTQSYYGRILTKGLSQAVMTHGKIFDPLMRVQALRPRSQFQPTYLLMYFKYLHSYYLWMS